MNYQFTEEQRQAASRDPVMVDLETLSTRPTAAIISIGACKFDPSTGEITDTFHVIIGARRYKDYPSSESTDLLFYPGPFHVDPETVKWWEKQTEAASAASYDAVEGTLGIREALVQFAEWCGDVEVWGNGSDFDNAILAHAFSVCGIPQPWKFWNNRCYRTMKNQFPQVKLRRVGEHHNAVDDAVTQAKHLMQILDQRNQAMRLLHGA